MATRFLKYLADEARNSWSHGPAIISRDFYMDVLLANFVGANAELKRLQEAHRRDNVKVIDVFSKDCLNWNFIPPNNPHISGLLETAVNSLKFHIRRVARNTSFTFEELYTLLVFAACSYSVQRSKWPQLTPGHYLVRDAQTTIPEGDLRETVNRLSRWQHMEQVCQHFWSRWQREYLVDFSQG